MTSNEEQNTLTESGKVGKTDNLREFHAFVTPESMPGKPTPDRCIVCGNARCTLYHGSYMEYDDRAILGRDNSMKLSQKKTCAGCICAGPSYSPCELGFKVRQPLESWKPNTPLERCYKPKIADEWLRARELVRTERETA